MEITTKGRHAVRIMVDIAQHNNEFVPISEIASREEISNKYLEKIISMLVKADLLESMRGAMGGYRLKQPTKKISVAQILDAVNENTTIAGCTKDENCPSINKCETAMVWSKLSNMIKNYLNHITLKDLLTTSKPKCK